MNESFGDDVINFNTRVMAKNNKQETPKEGERTARPTARILCADPEKVLSFTRLRKVILLCR